MINVTKIGKVDITTLQSQYDYKMKRINLPVDILYTKDAVAGRKRDEYSLVNGSIPMNTGTRVYIGKEVNRRTFVAIKEIAVNHKNGAKNTADSKNRMEQVKQNLFYETLYMNKVKSACGPINIFYNRTATRLYLVQNLMTGTASDTLDAIRPQGSDLPARSTVLIMCALATRHLIELHKKDILHLDIKPINLMYSKQQNRVEFIDYGLSTQGPRAHSRGQGTPAYASAAQMGHFECTKRDDLVSLGVTFIELMTKNALFTRLDRGLAVAHEDFRYRNDPYQNPRVKAKISWVMDSVEARHPEFAHLCEQMVDDRRHPHLTAALVYEQVSKMVQNLDEKEYTDGKALWDKIPSYVERIQSRINALVLREKELPKKSK
jgi:serine/threonine protein kinase